jgi:lipoate-protein ligase A
MGRADVHEIEERFVGVRYDRAALADTCRTVEVRDYFGDITREELLALMIG